jgi:hypothetical protein
MEAFVPRFRSSLCASAALVLTPFALIGAQSTVTVSPFVSYVPSAASNPLAGIALTFGGTTGLALRAGADMSIENPNAAADPASTGGYRPWTTDADVMLFLGGLGGGATVFSRSLSPYVFSGIGLSGGDSAGTNVVRHGWSYGGGAAIPLGMHADVFGEARWRMSEYVLPTAKDAPSSKSELRFGLSFHVGGSSQAEPSRTMPRRRQRASYEYDEEPQQVIVTQPAPVIVQSAPVIVQEPAPVIYQTPEPVVVYEPAPVVTQPAPVYTPTPTTTTTTTTTSTSGGTSVIAPRRGSVLDRRASRARRVITAEPAPTVATPAPPASSTTSRVFSRLPRATAQRSRASAQTTQPTTQPTTQAPRVSAQPPRVISRAPRARVQAAPQAKAQAPAQSQTSRTCTVEARRSQARGAKTACRQ